MSIKPAMKYQILSSLRISSSLKAMQFLEAQVTEALEAGGSLVGGVSVIYDQEHGYEAFQAVLVPKIENDAA